MSRLEITAPDKAQLVIEGLYKDLERRIESSPPAAEKPADRRYERRRNYGNIRSDGRTLCINHGRS